MRSALAVLSLIVWSTPSTAFAAGQTGTFADTIYLNTKIETMDARSSVAEAIAIRDGSILAVGTNRDALQYRGRQTRVNDLRHQAAILPGFIDTHSHMITVGIFSDPRWVDVSSVNVLLKPPAGDPRCLDPRDYQKCFVPVQNQDEVIERLRKAVARLELKANPSKSTEILGFNYDPSRLGHSKECRSPDGVAFDCPNFEDGHAREYLDRISIKYPILITSESGHIVYVNSRKLYNLHICGVNSDKATVGDANRDKKSCHEPITQPATEKKLANLGQLDEDLALWAIEKVKSGDPLKAIQTAAQSYAAHGYTLAQEGAAGKPELLLYDIATKRPQFPLTVAAVVYDVDSPADDLEKEIKIAKDARAKAAGNPNLLIAAIKAFADGSTQGYTAYLKDRYPHLYHPFNDPQIFPQQPYRGLPDFNKSQLSRAAKRFHEAGFPIFIHMNGDSAIDDVLGALREAGPPPRGHDFTIHFQMGSRDALARAKDLNTAVTFLTEDLYYYGLPLCQQIFRAPQGPPGPTEVANFYPAGDATRMGIRLSLHPDTDVTPAYPLFAIWVAKTRKTQQPTWYPNKDARHCPVVMGPSQAITIRQGIKAYTIDAAWMYGLEDKLGSLEVNKTADLVILSDDPLEMEDRPDKLKTVRVFATVHRGQYLPNPQAAEKPIWPD